MFRDNYTNFSFCDLRSENFKVWITNKNDLQRNMSPNFSDKFNSPTYGQTRYYEGTTIDKQDFKISCVAKDVTLAEWNAITEWLSPLKIGKLRFDWNNKRYYVAKLSKAPTGVMFMKGRVDNVLGQLFIIEFSIEFTTTYDWAALGTYNEYGVKDESEGLVVDNVYYMPTVVFKDSKKALDEAVDKNTDITGDYIIKFSYAGSDSFQAKYTQIFDLNNGLWVSIRKEDNSAFVTANGENYDEIEKLRTEVRDEDIWYILNSRPGAVIKAIESVKYETYGNNLLIANPGSFNMYPKFFIKGTGSVKDNYKTYYNFNKVENVLDEDYVSIDGRTGNMTCYGVPIELSTSFTDIKAYIDIVNNGQFYIPSGRPEIVKGYYDGSDTIYLNNKPMYGRAGSYLVLIFTSIVEDTNEYDVDDYGTKNYYTSLRQYKLYDSIALEYESSSKGWKMTMPTVPVLKSGGELSKGYVYISICDYNSYSVTGDDIIVGTQIRDVI